MTAWIGNPPLSIPAYPTPVFETGRPRLSEPPDAPLRVLKREPDATGGTHVSFNRPMGTDETVKALFPDAKSWVQIEKEPLIQISGGSGHDWRVTLADGKEVELNFPGRAASGRCRRASTSGPWPQARPISPNSLSRITGSPRPRGRPAVCPIPIPCSASARHTSCNLV